MNHVPCILAAVVFCLGFPRSLVKAASCPGLQINATELCKNISSEDDEGSSNFTRLVCDNLQNVSRWNRSSLHGAFELLLKSKEDLQPQALKVFVSEANTTELEAALDGFLGKVNASLIPAKQKGILLEALWDGKLRNEERFNETEFVGPWFQKRLRPFLSAISADILQCLHNETMRCAQYQAIVKALDLEFKEMSHTTQETVYRSFQLSFLKGLKAEGSACVDGLTNTSAWLSVNLRRFSRYAVYTDLLSLNAAFSGFDVLHSLTVKQLAQLTVANGTVEATEDLQRLLAFVTGSTVAEYIDELNRQVNLANSSLETETKAVLLQHILVAARPILRAANDTEFIHWMNPRLAGLIAGLNRTHVPLLFEGLQARACTAIKAV